MKSARSRVWAWLVPAGFVAIASVLAARRLSDFDLPWHLALGRVVAKEHALPRIDPLAFTARPIQYMEFVSDLCLYGAERAGGALGLQLFGALVAACTGLVLWLRTRRQGPVAVALVGLALVAMHDFFLVRPATLSFLLMAIWLWALELHRSSPDTRRGRRALWSCVPLAVLWVNVHGFAVVGVAVAVGYAAYRSLARLAAPRLSGLFPAEDGTRLGETWLASLAVVAASGANLAGFRLLTAPFRASADFTRITEWAPTSFSLLWHSEQAAGLMLAVTLAALALGREPGGKRLPNAFDLGLVLLALVLARSAVRLVPLATVMVTPVVVRRLAGFVRDTREMRLACGAALWLAAPVIAVTGATSFGIGFEPSHFPEGAVGFVEANKPVGRMWNFLPFGGYLSWRLWPEYRVLVDGRSGWVHDPALLDRVHASEHDDAAFESLVSELDLQWAITRASEGEAFGLPLARSSAFRMVYFDDVSAIYVRTSAENAALAARGYHVLRHLTPPGKALSAAVERSVPPADLAADGRLARAQAPSSSRAVFFDACGALALRDAAALSNARERLNELAPGHPALAALEQAARAAGM